jgi:hypothetical protein
MPVENGCREISPLKPRTLIRSLGKSVEDALEKLGADLYTARIDVPVVADLFECRCKLVRRKVREASSVLV